MINKKGIFVLALDGVPFSFLKDLISSGKIPNIEKLVKDNVFRSMNSVVPTVSSSAWASFLTGKYPNQHGILSFTERDPYTMDWYTPNADNLKTDTILENLSKAGKKVFSMNVPVTFPPKPLNGISICGFLGTDIEHGTYPAEEGTFLKENGYRIDSDSELAKKDLSAFFKDLYVVLEKRIEMMWHYFEKGNWDFFMAHIMETDRLHHFSWEYMEKKDPIFLNIYEKFYSRLDDLVGEILTRAGKETKILFLSDHGFTTLKEEVYLNRWLWENDYLKFTKPIPESLKDIHPKSKAYALYPGRIFINLKGREKNGSVNPGYEFESLKGQIKNELFQIKSSVAKETVIKEILNPEDVYDFKKSYSTEINLNLADLYVFANNGYDLKGVLWGPSLFSKTVFNGMHSFDNAFVLARGIDIEDNELSITDLAKYI